MVRVPFIVGGQSVSLITDHFGGIGNRIIPMGCILSLAAELNYRPIVFWPASKVVGGATFGDLFESTNLPFELREGYEAQIMSVALFESHRPLARARKKGLSLLRRLVSLQYDKIITHMGMGKNIGFSEIRDLAVTDLRLFRKIGFSVYELIRYGYDISWLKPTPQIASRITELKQQFAPNTVGVHLRGTDLRILPVNKIIARMRAEIDLDSDVKFFLASDGDKRGEAIITLFKDRLIESQKSTGRVPILVSRGPAATKQILEGTERGTILGQQDAVVDMFGLAATSRIIGAGYSSFGRLAALIGNKPLLGTKSIGLHQSITHL